MVSSGKLKNIEHMPALHQTLRDRNLDKLKEYLKSNSSVHEIDFMGRSPLHVAVEFFINPDDCYEACKLLLEHGAAVDHTDKNGRTPLHDLWYLNFLRESDRNEKLFNLLVSKGANINKEDTYKRTLFKKAFDANDFWTCRKLLELGADLSTQNNLLIDAVYKKDERYVKLLLEYGVRSGLQHFVYYIITQRKQQLLQLMFEYGVEFDLCNCHKKVANIMSICHLNFLANSSTLEILLENGKDIQTYNECPIFCYFLDEIYEKIRNSYMSKLDSDSLKEHEALVDIIIRQAAIRFKSCSSEVDTPTQSLIRNEKYFTQLVEKYAKQLHLMKSTLVKENSKVTYFDFLAKQGKPLIECCDSSIISAISKEKCENLFPDFTEKLMRRVRVGVSQRTNRKEYEQVLYGIFGKRLLFEAVIHICDFLSMRDIRESSFRVLNAQGITCNFIKR